MLLLFNINVHSFAEKINIQIVEEQTLKSNPSIALAKLDLDNAKREYKSSFDAFLPKVNFVVNTIRKNQENILIQGYSYGLNVSLSLFSGFSNYNEVKSKAARVKVKEAAYKRVVCDAIYKVNKEYIKLMWAYENFELLKQIKEKRIENRDLIKLKYSSGNVDIGSLKREEADVMMAECKLMNARRYILAASVALMEAMGKIDNVTILETDERLMLLNDIVEEPDYSNLITMIPEFKIAKYELEICKYEKAIAIGQWLPLLAFSGNFLKSNEKWMPDQNNLTTGIYFSCPIFTGGKRYADTKICSNNFKEASLKLINTISFLKSSMVKRYNSLIDVHDSVRIIENYLSALKLQAEISTKKYVNGLESYYNWYAIEKDFIDTQRMLLDAKKNVALEKAKWRNFIGVSLNG
ncbi:MAG: TolC family protein [Endomicrobium sp.]|nr:TolC family protein [Endomicrobium sp.]